jgi:tRNA-dihydrouridine synthase A
MTSPHRPYPLSVAPMMDWTDRHYRAFMRGVTRRTLLYTEMVHVNAVLRGHRERVLGFSELEKPLALQLGGDDPQALAACARVAEDWGYDELNLNVGCPSPRVQRGNFGACLMAQPERVAACVAAMRAATSLPVTVKHRIGIDDRDRFEDLAHFVEVVAQAGPARFTVHARKAWLSGLSPKENRTVPPLRYEAVYRLKRLRPDLELELNGGVRSLEAAAAHLEHVDAVMIGRAAYETPYALARADALFYGEAHVPTRREVLEVFLPYASAQLGRGVPLASLTRHLLGLFAGVPGARAWRRHLSEQAHRAGAGLEVLQRALRVVPDEVLDARPDAPQPVERLCAGR